MPRDTIDIQKRYPLLLRWSRAIELFRELGGSERTLRRAKQAGTVKAHVLRGETRAYYSRDAIVRVCEAAVEE